MTSRAFQGQVVLITGASSGIGRATAEAFAAAGASVALAARSTGALHEAAQAIEARGGRALAVPADVTQRASVDACVRAVRDTFGRLDVLVNNAGLGRKASLEQTTDEEIETLVRTNVVGTLYATRAALPHLREVAGTIVLISSVAGRRGFPWASVYCATKFALAGLAESLRIELAGTGVKVVLICPGRVDTDFFAKAGFPIEHGIGGRASMARPADVAAMIVRDVARGRREHVLSRGGKVIVWLNKLAPSACDRLIARLPP